MKSLCFSILGMATVLSFIVVVFLLSRPVQADDCCPPPAMPPVAVRFLPNSQVTVYVDTSSGFTTTEVQAIKAGLEDWNDEPNNSGVKYTVVPTDNPPAPGADKTVVAKFVNEPGSTDARINLSRSTVNGATTISGVLTYWNRIRSGTPSLLPAFLRSTSRHEGGHGVGLDNSDTNGCPEGSNIMFPSRNVETFITPCDNGKINQDPFYGGTPTPTPDPPPPPPPPPPGECNQFPSVCDPPDGWSWDWCCCVSEYLLNNGSWPCTDTPVIYDSNHNGLDLSDAEHGVAFDIDANGSLDIIGWPIDPDDKLLVFDRNGNGKVDDARELFGNKTPQPDSPSGWAQNGFLALAEFDKPKNGGNADGLFSIADRGFSLLRLWSDKDRNGTSEPDEMETLPTDLVIELKYHRMNKYDRNGNRLRYRSGKWVWDVILARANNPFKRSKPAW